MLQLGITLIIYFLTKSFKKFKRLFLLLCLKLNFAINTSEMDPGYTENEVDYRSLGNMPGLEWKLLRVY